MQQHQGISAQTLADYRNARREAQRLAPRYRQASQAAQMRQTLVDLVGEKEVQRLVADARYEPWWLTER